MFNYLRSTAFKRYIPDWIVAVVLGVYFFVVAEYARPFIREFSLSDLTISHPFTVHERVPGVNCILLSFFIPFFTMLVVSAVKNAKNRHQILHSFQVGVLGLCVALTINGVVTDILKNWISRPRPDFLARCGPRPGTPVKRLVDISVCTAPLGPALLIDGMRSTPSGHSSIAFSGLTYLTLWLLGQFKLLHATQHLYKYLLTGLPVLLASYIALSRTQDYRHHFTDIILGSIIGVTFAVLSNKRYYNSLWSEESDKPVEDEPEPLLPR